MKRILGIAAFVLAVFMPSHALAANTWGTDLSDLWWNPSESGWGANIAHQGEVIFLTLFVYGTDGGAKWFVGPAITSRGGSDSFSFVGDIYETRGPYFGINFNPDVVTRRPVGSASITFSSANDARISYMVDGVSITKLISRQTFRSNNLTGRYTGATFGSTTGCGTGSGTFSNARDFVIAQQDGGGIVINASTGSGVACTISGTYSQYGRMGGIVGTTTCANGRSGAFEAYEVEAGYQGFASRYSADFGGGCVETGRMGGMKQD